MSSDSNERRSPAAPAPSPRTRDAERVPDARARASGLRDREGFSLAWYGQTVQYLVSAAGLVPLTAEAALLLGELPGARSGHLVAASPDLLEPDVDLGSAVVVGGPCIGDCTAWPTLEALYDSVQPILTAKALGAPCVLFVGDQEEIMGRGGKGQWVKLGKIVERWLRSVARACEWDEQLTVVRTSTPEHDAALDVAGHPCSGVDGRALDAAFSLTSDVSEQGEEARAVTRRVIEAHLPAVVAHHLGRDEMPRVLMAENLQQAGVHAVIRSVTEPVGQRVSFLGHWPAPCLSAGTRMYRARSWEKIPSWELVKAAGGRLAGVERDTSQFFDTWLEPDLRGRLADAAPGK